MPHPYSVVPFTDQHFFKALSSESSDTKEVANQDRATYLLEYLREIGVGTIVVEYDYTDGDYLEDFASYYVKCFHPYERRCKRVHFFSRKFDEPAFHELVVKRTDAKDISALNEDYCGFVVARPLPNAVVGRTILRTYPSDNGRRNYKAVKTYQVNLFGVELSIESLAFQEQDSVLAACATVALWCSFHKTSDLFDSASPRPAEITKMAGGVINEFRTIPSHGLSLQQMAHAVKAVGLEPELVPAKSSVPLVSLIYGHLKYGLPVVLLVTIEGIGDHAVTIVGYSLNKSKLRDQEVATGKRSIPMVGLRINEFYCHDDQIGPFARLSITPSTKDCPIKFEGDWKDSSTGKRLTLTPVAALIPIYNKVRVTFQDIQIWLERFSALLPLVLMPDQQQEWDLYLTTTNEYKSSFALENSAYPSLPDILFNQQPRFMWRASLSSDGQKLMEILFDATDMARSLPVLSITWHNDSFKGALQLLFGMAGLESQLDEVLQPKFRKFIQKNL